MSSELIIRPVARQDYQQWLPLWDGYNAFYARRRPSPADRHRRGDVATVL